MRRRTVRDQDIRTPKGTYLSFDTTPSGKFILNILGATRTMHVELSDENMEQLMELVAQAFYGAEKEDTEAFLKRVIKEALAEKEAEDKPLISPPGPASPYGPASPWVYPPVYPPVYPNL